MSAGAHPRVSPPIRTGCPRGSCPWGRRVRGSGTASPPAPCLHPRPRCFENSAWRPSAVSIPQTPLTDWNPIVPCSSPHPQTGTWTHFPDEQSGLGSSVWKMGLECPRRGWGPRERKEKCAQLKAGVAVARSGAADVRGTRGGPGQGGASEAPCSPQTGWQSEHQAGRHVARSLGWTSLAASLWHLLPPQAWDI